MYREFEIDEKLMRVLPEYVKEEVYTLIESKARYHASSSLENLQQMKIDYHNAYTALKHCVVSGIIQSSLMDELTNALRHY